MLTQVKAIIGVFSRRRENTFSAYYQIIQKNHFHTPRVKIESGDASNIYFIVSGSGNGSYGLPGRLNARAHSW